jgi:phenylpyruvate C(3)-methyltransferase
MTSIQRDAAEKAVAHIYNSAVAAWAIGAAWELGLLDELKSSGIVDASEFAARQRLDLPSTLGLVRALAAVEVVERNDTKVMPASNFAEVFRTRSFFHWLTRGNSALFASMPEVLRIANRNGSFYRRDPAAIAFACREINCFCYDPWFWAAVDALEFDATMVADLGCGSGERVMRMVSRAVVARGLGIDIASPPLAAARSEAEKAGLRDRVTFLEADILTMEARPEFAEIDLITCFMMGHDFWPRQRCVYTLQRLSALFPNAQAFLLGDATRTIGVRDQDLPVFTLGFELAHDMMGSYMPTLADWESVFESSPWRLRKKHSIGISVGEVIFELERRR